MAELLPNTNLSHYRIVSKLGAGGMGEVYLAQDTKLDRQVALKILPEDLASDAERMRRFVQEAKAASALNHPNIITIHEIGEAEGAHFIATEFIDGPTLRERLDRGPLPLDELLGIAGQTAEALTAAHAAGIVHRDIKPENIMLRPDGYVKVLDFGIAKLTEHTTGAIDTEGATAKQFNTGPGSIMGTTAYMSPEQVRSQVLDARTDVWSLGAVLYEMIASQKLFPGETPGDVIAAILKTGPPPLAQVRRDCPAELERIVRKALHKKREKRYQLVSDLGRDLKSLKRRLEFEAELERSGAPIEKSGELRQRTSAGAAEGTAAEASTQTASEIHTTSSAEYIVSQIKTHRRGFAFALIPLVIVAAALSYFFYFKSGHAPLLTEKDTILLADFDNQTGDPVFDRTLKQGLAVILGQSPFLDIFPESRVRETLQSMEHKPDDVVTEPLAREICLRQGLKAFLTGAIASLGSHYVITLKAVNAQTGDEMASEQTEAESKEQVLKTISQAATRLREKLGESLSSIQKFDAPIEQATTASLDALKAYSLGLEQANSGNYPKAIPFLQLAIELDPNFALGYLSLARNQLNSGRNNEATVSASKAFELRERATENEKLYITLFYYRVVTHDLEKAIEVGEVWKQTYPHNWRTYHALADLYIDVGQFEKAVANGREAMRLNPKVAAVYSNPAGALIFLNRFAEAKEIYQQALANNLDAPEYHMYLYWIAYYAGDTATMAQEQKWEDANSYPYWSLTLQAQTAALDGKWHKAKNLSNQATAMLERSGIKGFVARLASHVALTGAVFGDCQTAKQKATQALASVNDASYSESAVALAMCGEVSQAQAHMATLAPLYPNDTRFNGIWLPVIRAAIELQRGQPAQALQLLEPVRRYEAASDFQPQYLRGLAYLRLGQGAEAAAEFQKIIDRHGLFDIGGPALYSLAHLGLARASSVSGDASKARKAYEDFLTRWKDADADLPILIEAKKEYARLR
ncbi:MAG: protein kinase domain-containing protein [Pyrinomonadaceae bacterium]